MSMIHPSSVVSPKAQIGANVEIGPFCYVRDGVTLGDNCYLDSHVVIGGATGEVIVGKNNKFFAGASIGGAPQDLKYKGENTKLIIGDNNTIRECVTMNIGTVTGHGETRIGNNNLIMSYVHVAHDNVIGSYNVMANNLQLAGHVTIEDRIVIGGSCAINQFVRIGKHAFVTGGSMVNKDVLPFSICQGDYAVIRGTNKIGLTRSGMSDEVVNQINRAIRILTKGTSTIEEALERIKKECEPCAEIHYLYDFVKSSTRGLAL